LAGDPFRASILTALPRGRISKWRSTEIRKPDRLVFTWRWEEELDESGPGKTLVTDEVGRFDYARKK
jgi:hypothetical protein